MSITDPDQRLIALLRENGRYSVAELARRLFVSRTAAQARLEKLEKKGVIAGYTVRLSREYREAEVRALVMVKARPSKRTAIEVALSRIPGLMTLYSISGEFDLTAVVAAHSVTDLDDAIDRIGNIEGVEDTMSSVILATKIDR